MPNIDQKNEKDKRKPNRLKFKMLWGVETQIRSLSEKQGPKEGWKKFRFLRPKGKKKGNKMPAPPREIENTALYSEGTRVMKVCCFIRRKSSSWR